MLVKLGLLACAGAVGVLARYGVTAAAAALWPGRFPVGVLVVNALGCLAIGLLAGAYGPEALRSQTRLVAVAAGLLGGFTTFSAFGLDAVALFREGRPAAGALYIGLSNGLSLAAAAAGWALAAPRGP